MLLTTSDPLCAVISLQNSMYLLWDQQLQSCNSKILDGSAAGQGDVLFRTAAVKLYTVLNSIHSDLYEVT